jgi:hypothetical protein
MNSGTMIFLRRIVSRISFFIEETSPQGIRNVWMSFIYLLLDCQRVK